MCDFGVSGQLIDSMANSFVGTRSYMSVSKHSNCLFFIKGQFYNFHLISLVLLCL